MREQEFLAVCILMALLGVIGMFLLNKLFVSEVELDDLKPGKIVKVCGKLKLVRKSKRATFFNLTAGDSSILVVAFHDVKIKNASCVIGRTNVYKGKLEIIALKFLP